ncbi:MAG: Gx transporter family protein [Bacilli bacterium]|jgi:heptaprenyl diphosphate synthase|nr:Gx transporter family protein [Bacilli bacterium]
MKNITRKIVVLSILLAMCVALSVIDSLISGAIISILPNIRLGISNIIILIVLYQYGFKEGLVLSVMKSIIVGLLINGPVAFLIGGLASVLSVVGMYLVKKSLDKYLSIVSVSFVGGLIHILIQLLVVSLIYKMYENVLMYGVYLVLISIITSIIIGVVSFYVNRTIDKNDLLKKEKSKSSI